MNPTTLSQRWSSDRVLDILILGPMGDPDDSPASTIPVRDAVESLLTEPKIIEALSKGNIIQASVSIPEGQEQGEIVQNVLKLLDTADLVIFNLTQKKSNPDRANVFYELGLVHSLGIPAMLLVSEGTPVPFYARTTINYPAENFSSTAIAKVLRSPLEKFLTEGHVVNDRVTQFYGLPIVDISAAVGLATGYYYNFLSRLITENSFITAYPELIRHVVYIRPDSISSTYESDIARLKTLLAEANLEIKEERLPPPENEKKGPLWFEHVNGVVFDIPRTIYPLRRSPRILSMLERDQVLLSDKAEIAFEKRKHQIEDSLLNRVQAAIRYQIRHDGPRVRSSILKFTTIDEAPEVIKDLLND